MPKPEPHPLERLGFQSHHLGGGWELWALPAVIATAKKLRIQIEFPHVNEDGEPRMHSPEFFVGGEYLYDVLRARHPGCELIEKYNHALRLSSLVKKSRKKK